MKTTSLIFFFSFFFFSCSKEEARPDCEVNRKFYLVVSNASADSYDIYVGNVYRFTVQPGTVTPQKEIPLGTYSKTLIVAQSTANPKTIEYMENLTPCQGYSIQLN